MLRLRNIVQVQPMPYQGLQPQKSCVSPAPAWRRILVCRSIRIARNNMLLIPACVQLVIAATQIWLLAGQQFYLSHQS